RNTLMFALTLLLEKLAVHRELALGLLLAPRLPEGPGQGVVRLGIVRPELDGAAEPRDRLIRPAAGGEDHSDVVVRVRIEGGQTDRLLEFVQRLVVAALRVVRPAQVEMGL